MRLGTLSKKSGRRVCAIVLLFTVFLSLTACSKEEKEQVTDLSQLKDGYVAVLLGSSFAKTVKQDSRLEGVQLVYTSSNSDSLAMLLSGKVDAIVTDNTMAQQVIRMNKGLCILEDPLEEAGYGIAFPKNSELLAEFNSVLTEMEADGTLAELEEKWLGDNESVKTAPEQTGSGENGTITCRVSADFSPIVYKDDNGNLLGFDIDMVMKIADRLGYRIEFSETEFSDLIPSLEANQIDFVVAGVTITEERRQLVDFSDPYLSADTVVIVGNGSDTTTAGVALTVKNSLHRTFIEEGRWQMLIQGLGTTIFVFLIAAAFALVLGFLIFLGAYLGKPWLKKIVMKCATIMGLMPPSTWLMLVFYVFFAGNSGSNMVACLTALSIFFSFDVFDAFYSAVNEVNVGQHEAATSMGYSRFDALIKIILPQSTPYCLAKLQSAVKGHVRATALVGYASVMDIQAVADLIRAETYGAFAPIILTAVIYIGLGAICCRLIGCVKIGAASKQRTPEEIKERLMRGKL